MVLPRFATKGKQSNHSRFLSREEFAGGLQSQKTRFSSFFAHSKKAHKLSLLQCCRFSMYIQRRGKLLFNVFRSQVFIIMLNVIKTKKMDIPYSLKRFCSSMIGLGGSKLKKCFAAPPFFFSFKNYL